MTSGGRGEGIYDFDDQGEREGQTNLSFDDNGMWIVEGQIRTRADTALTHGPPNPK